MKYCVTYMAALIVANEVGMKRMNTLSGLFVLAVLGFFVIRMIQKEKQR